MFSQRTAWPSELGPFGALAARARAQGALDLCCFDPASLGLRHPPAVYRALLRPGVECHDPDPLGLKVARQAICDDYLPFAVPPEHVCLTSGTSEAYAHLLSILSDPGDAIAVPMPGYPLLEHVASLSGVRTVPYPVVRTPDWICDVDAIDACLAKDPGIRAVVLISPHNPTGHRTDFATLSAIEHACARRSVALVVDEVFRDYALDGTRPSAVGPRECLTFVVSGLSKVAALPQLKLAWAIACGPPDLVATAMDRVVVVADTFLSVSTPSQLAAPELLAAAGPMRTRIMARLRHNRGQLADVLADTPISVLPVEAGWTVLLRPPMVLDESGWVEDLVMRAGILLQPGYLYDLPRGPFVVASLLTPPERLAEGVKRLAERVRTVLDEHGGAPDGATPTPPDPASLRP